MKNTPPKLLNNVKFLEKCIVVNSEGKLLTLRRPPDTPRRPNCWDLPGGNYEEGEDVNEALRREIREETGLAAHTIKPLYIASSYGKLYEGKTIFALTQICSEWEGEVALSDEHVEYRWVTPQEFLEMETGDDGGFLKSSVKEYSSLPSPI